MSYGASRLLRSERGSVVPLVALVLLLGALLVLGSARLGSGVVSRARADSVADMVALSAVTGGESAARSVASANGATLTSHVLRGDGSTLVEISVGAVTSVAAAEPGN